MTRTENASKNIIWGILARVVGLIMPFLSRTVMIKTIGIEYVGLGGLFTSLLVVLSFAELGVGNAIVFSMYKPIAENDEQKVCALLALIYPFLNRFKSEIKNNSKNIIFYTSIILTPISIKLVLSIVQYMPILDYYYKYSYRFNSEANIIGFGLLWLLPIVLFVILYRKKLIENDSNNEALFNIFLLKIPLVFSGYYMIWCARLRLFAEISELLIIPMIIKNQSKKFNKICLTIFVIVYYITNFIYKFFINGVNDMFPYQTIIQTLY